ncbi:hypothetical protein K488DRAFT_28002, partial [Vararia minispora EC-137]
LPLEETLRDLALLRASELDLRTLLSVDSKDGVAPTPVDASVKRSFDFVQAARAAIRIHDRGDVEKEGEKLEGVRATVDE